MPAKIRVLARIRPVLDDSTVIVHKSDENHVIVTPSKHQYRRVCPRYKFSHVFDETTSQEQVFQQVLRQLESKRSCTVLMYGQTGSGKTHTILGCDFSQYPNNFVPEACGLIPRVFHFLQSSKHPVVNVSYMEIYNDRVYDLFNTTTDKRISLEIRQSSRVVGLETKTVSSMSEILDLLAQGAQVRATRATDLNEQSSRSHTIFQFTCQDTKQVIQLVDLAGSEKYPMLPTAKTSKQHVVELAAINKSLSCLGQCISALNRQCHVPFRNSKLTRILQHVLTAPDAELCLIVTLAPGETCYDETLSTLQFADRAKRISTAAVVNPMHPSAVAATATATEKQLRQQLEHEKAINAKLLHALALLLDEATSNQVAWEEYLDDETGETYYHNPTTGVTQWECPYS